MYLGSCLIEGFYLDLPDKLAPSYGRLAPLSNGMVITVLGEALPADIMVYPRIVWKKQALAQCILTVRPCESRSPTDLKDALEYRKGYDGDDLEGSWFQHASLKGFYRGSKSPGIIPTPDSDIPDSTSLDQWHVPSAQDKRPHRLSRISPSVETLRTSCRFIHSSSYIADRNLD